MKTSQVLATLSLLLFTACAGKSVTNREQVRNTVKTVLPQIKDCYSSALKDKPDLKGRVVMQFEVDDAGKVSSCSAKAGSTLNTPTVDKCICDKLTATMFPPAPKGQKAMIDYPFVFSSTN